MWRCVKGHDVGSNYRASDDATRTGLLRRAALGAATLATTQVVVAKHRDHSPEHLTDRRTRMAKKTRKRVSIKRSRPAGKRDLVRRPRASAYAKRTARGRFKEMDDIGRSQKTDKRRKAKKTVRSGYGDQGDKRPRATRKTRG
jgi:hypothetical protein